MCVCVPLEICLVPFVHLTREQAQSDVRAASNAVMVRSPPGAGCLF
jgi:hypothetical protein